MPLLSHLRRFTVSRAGQRQTRKFFASNGERPPQVQRETAAIGKQFSADDNNLSVAQRLHYRGKLPQQLCSVGLAL